MSGKTGRRRIVRPNTTKSQPTPAPADRTDTAEGQARDDEHAQDSHPFIQALPPVTPGGVERVGVFLCMDRFATIPHVGGRKAIDRLTYAYKGHLKCHDYGEGRYYRDGAKTIERTKDAQGEAVERKLSKPERRKSASVHADNRYEVLRGKRVAHERGVTLNPVIRFLRQSLVTFLCSGKVLDAEGETYTSKSIPSGIVSGTEVDRMRVAATAIGVTLKRFEHCVTQAGIAADAQSSALDLDIDDTPKRRTRKRKASARKRK